MAKKGELTPKQQRFVQEYLVDLNGTQAAIRAGYSPKTARTTAAEYLAKPNIANAVGAAKRALGERTRVDQEWVIGQLVVVYNKAMEDQPVTDSDGNVVGSKWSTGPVATKALELLGKTNGSFTDRLDINGSINVNARNLTDEELAEIAAGAE